MKLTPEMLAASYEFLRTTLPFKHWKLPHADEVAFSVMVHKKNMADHCIDRKQHTIRVAENHTVSTDALLCVMAHEMVHAYQDGVTKTGSRRVVHNKEFVRLGKRICAIHGWNINLFMGA